MTRLTQAIYALTTLGLLGAVSMAAPALAQQQDAEAIRRMEQQVRESQQKAQLQQLQNMNAEQEALAAPQGQNRPQGQTAEQILNAQPTAPTAPAAPVVQVPTAPIKGIVAPGTGVPVNAAATTDPNAPEGKQEEKKPDPCAAFMRSNDLYASCTDRQMKIERLRESQKARANANKPAPVKAQQPVNNGAQNAVPQTTTVDPNAPVDQALPQVGNSFGRTGPKVDPSYIESNSKGFVIKKIKGKE